MVKGFFVILEWLTLFELPDGSPRWLPALEREIGNLTLLEEVRKGKDILRRASAIDGLTGLQNRKCFDECLDRQPDDGISVLFSKADMLRAPCRFLRR